MAGHEAQTTFAAEMNVTCKDDDICVTGRDCSWRKLQVQVAKNVQTHR